MTEELLLHSTDQGRGPDAQVLQIRRRTNRIFRLFVVVALLVVVLVCLAILLEH